MKYDVSSWRKWLLPMTAIASIAVVSFTALYSFDYFIVNTPPAGGDAVRGYFFFSPSFITDAVPALAGMIAAVLGIVITVVSIVVQLSAERYPGVATMFLRDKTNIGVMGFYVVACVSGVLSSLSLHENFVPIATVMAMVVATTCGLVLMAPYFAYVFWFLEPTNIIARIRSDALKQVERGARSRHRARLDEAQGSIVAAMEELNDISSNSISGKDKIIASRAVDALKDFAVNYIMTKKSEVPADWFQLGEQIRENPDFVAMEPESRKDLVDRRTWVEWKVMRQYLGIYNEAIHTMPDINYLIAIDTRYIGEAAAQADDEELMLLVVRYMNSYLRATLNAKNVRTAYNVMNQYRQLVESMMRYGHGSVAVSAVEHMKYYGHVSYDMNLSFVTETVAYDIGTICEVAHELELDEEDEFLHVFLELDRATTRRGQEQALKGVRKAQVKLAAFYLLKGDEQRAREIYLDMADDPLARLAAIRHELARVDSKDFWEIIDRGRNFEFMPENQREAMLQFFRWFPDIDEHVPSSRRPVSSRN